MAKPGDIKKFSSAKKIIKYASLKKGNPIRRDLCYQMAYGEGIWNSGVIFAMLRKGEKFRPELVAPSTRLNNFEVICYG